jgi:hypothetical protein
VLDATVSVMRPTGVDVAVVEAIRPSGAVLDADEVGVELAVVGISVGSVLVDVALVEVAVSAATKPVLKVPITKRLIRRTLTAENAIVWVFIRLR